MADNKWVKPAIKKKQDDAAKELWVSIPPKATQCKTCIYAYPDTQYTIGAEKANCEMFEPPDDKPMGVLWKDEPCPFYDEGE